MNSRIERKRTVAIVLAFAAAAALCVAALGPKWLHNLDGDQRMGLRAMTVCVESHCESMSNFKVIDYLNKQIEEIKVWNATHKRDEQRAVPREPWGGFPVVGLITIVTGILAAAGLVYAAILALRRQRPELPIMPTTVAVLGLALAIINGCLFVATKPDMIDEMGVGWTFWTFGAGAVLGLASVFPLNRQIRPIDEELGAASATMSWGSSRDEE